MGPQDSNRFAKIFRPNSPKKKHDIASGVAAVNQTSIKPIIPGSFPQSPAVVTVSNNPDTSSRNESWTSNATLILDIVKEIGEVLENVPYVKMGAGIALKAIKVKEEIDACKEEWKRAEDYLTGINDMVVQFRGDTALLPEQVEDGFRELESCLSRVRDAKKQYQDEGRMKKMLKRGTLKAEATSCVEKIDRVHKLFQTKMGIHTYLSVKELSGAPPPVLPMRLDEVLRCPPPSQYFVGRQAMYQKLSKIFAVPVVIVFNKNQDILADFVKYKLKQFSIISLNGSTVETFEEAIADKLKADNQFPAKTLIVIENMDLSLKLDHYLPFTYHAPVLITTTHSAISSSEAHMFTLPDSSNQQVQSSIVKALTSGQHIVTLVAKGGTGKTQMILKFVSEQQSRFSNIWFLDATSETTLTADFKTLGQAAGIPKDTSEAVQGFLSRAQRDWLLIFDNADTPDLDLGKYIPRCNHGNVIITSRVTSVHQMASPGHCLNFDDLDHQEAVELLLKRANTEDSGQNKQLASNIVDALGCHALAVSTAAAYIASNATCDLSDYLSHFYHKSKNLLGYRSFSSDNYQHTVLSAFQLSFDQLTPSTQRLLQICSCFHHIAIPVKLFKLAAAFAGDDTVPGEKVPVSVPEMKVFLSLFTDDESWDDSINQLAKFSLATYDPSVQTLAFHSVIHSCTHGTIKEPETLKQVAQLLLARATPSGDTIADYQFRKQLLIHAENLLKKNLPTLRVYTCFANIFDDAGLWTQSVEIKKEDLRLCREVLGEHHPDTLTSMSNLAWTYQNLGQLEPAEKMQEEVLRLRREVLGEHHPDTLTSINNLALTYKDLGQLEAAEKMQEEELRLCREVLGEHHPDTLISMSNLASTYKALGQLKAAEKMQEEVLRLHREVFGEHHPSTLTSMSNLAATYWDLGQLEAAEKMQEEELRLCREVLGEYHPSTLTSMNNLASTYKDLGHLEAAEKMQEEELRLCREVLGEHHPSTLTSMSNLASTYQDLGQLEAAEKMQEEVLRLRREVLGEHHPSTLISMGNLALTYQNLGQLKAAEKMQEEVLRLCREVLGEYHPSTLTSMSNLALTYKALGQLEAAEKMQEEVLRLDREVLGEHHPDTLTSMSNLAATYWDLGQLEAAEKMQEEELRLCREVLGEHHPSTLTSMNNLASTYKDLGHLEAAEKMQEEILRLCREVLGEHHPDTLTTMSNLASIYQDLGQLEAAEKMQEEELRLHREVLGKHHLSTKS
ncbi:hypothetical protein VKT23_016800 [Stygiomarasmius scandens]|uniref:TPR-like protein n=1 Tax=Marasmiellus scandens TaxID=2682957 RepID=A0ABR1IWG5_9AGAR